MYMIDRYLVDMLLVDGIGRLPRWISRTMFQPLQNGVLQSYAIHMAGGVGLVVMFVLYMPKLLAWLGGSGG